MFQGTKRALEIIDENECHEVLLKLFDRIVMVSLGCILFKCSIKDLDLPIRPRMSEFCEFMLDPVFFTQKIVGLNMMILGDSCTSPLQEYHSLFSEQRGDPRVQALHQ